MRGRRVGTREISLEQIEEIKNLTLSKECSRPDIARKLHISNDTVWRWQKKLGLI